MRYVASYHLSPLTLVLLVVFLVVSILALLPQISSLSTAELRMAVIGVSGGVLILGFWAIRQTNRRLSRLSAVAREIEQGDYSSRVLIEGGDSIAQLSQAMNRMARRTEAVIVDLQDREKEVLRLSTHDSLTGFPNRRLFNELLAKDFAHAHRTGNEVGVILIDLDGFKNINDGLGHEAGDQILLQLAERIRKVTRAADTVARLGGDAFGILVSGAKSQEGVTKAAERIWQIFEDPFRARGQEIRISASAGIGIFPEHAQAPDLLVGSAESALRWVKARGGKRWTFFEPSMDQQAGIRLKLEQDFHQALRGDELLVHYQPVCSVRDGEILGLEALVRWQHPESGFMSAAQFIPTLEQAGLMSELGIWLLDKICDQTSRWRASGLASIPISVNISVRQFEAGNVAEVVAAALDRSGLAPELLQLEITESIAMNDVGQMIGHLQRCREIGVHIHLDDFGTGYSSLSYLLKFPVDVLKIDRTFIAGVPEHTHSVAIVKATLALARSLGLRVIAEGVETQEQLEFLRREDCELAQGYLLARPVPVVEIETLLAAGRVDLAASKR